MKKNNTVFVVRTRKPKQRSEALNPFNFYFTHRRLRFIVNESFSIGSLELITQAQKIKKWSVSGFTLPDPDVFWLAEHESEFRKPLSFSSFRQKIAKKKVQNPENPQELRLYFENRYISTSMHLIHLIPIYLYLSDMILTSMKIHNPQLLNKSSVKALITAKSGFHVMRPSNPEIAH